MLRRAVLCVLMTGSLVFGSVAPAGVRPEVIVCSGEGGALQRLAAKEVRRYVYLRTGELLPIMPEKAAASYRSYILVWTYVGNPQSVIQQAWRDPFTSTMTSSTGERRPDWFGKDEYEIKTLPGRVVIGGGNGLGTLYGAYRFAEILGVRFYLHGDVVPDERMPLDIPDIDEHGKPLFALRGIQPFHDFPEGPDWWGVDEYKAILSQLPKMGMNFFALHTYPEGGVGPEPTVWIGTEGEFDAKGDVKASYRSSWMSTQRGNWGYAPKTVSDYTYGADGIFAGDVYGSEVQEGMIPWPKDDADNNAVFNRTAQLLRDAFTHAHALGIRTCVGTETPLTIPKAVTERLKATGEDPADIAVVQDVYEGMFARIARAYPLDYYWFWTPEGWTWSGTKPEQVAATVADLKAAIAAAEEIRSPFGLATCGWVLGPAEDRSLFDKLLPREMALSCISRNVGFAPVERGFADVKGRPTWSIPWMEDDPGLSIPQLWVGRMRRDAADSLAYGCTGLMGIHWRTRILGPNVSALAKAAWDQKGWNPDFGKPYAPKEAAFAEGAVGGATAGFAGNAMAGTEDDPVYQAVRYNMDAYQLKVKPGRYKVTLQFCEPYYGEAGKRIFGVALQGKRVIDKLDAFEKAGKDRAVDFVFENVEVRDGRLVVGFVKIVEFPCIAGIVVEGPEQRKINCGGEAYKDWIADLPVIGEQAGSRDMATEDFYVDWARAEFGPAAPEGLGKLFARLDGGYDAAQRRLRGDNLPRPATWVNGPGCIVPDARPWEQVRADYAFVDEMRLYRPLIEGAGYRERFDYWLNQFEYMRAMARVNCLWGAYNAAMEKVRTEKDAAARKQLARETALPLRKELVRCAGDVHRHLLASISTTGGMGSVMNWQQHLLPDLLDKPGAELAAILGEPLAEDAMPAKVYAGPARVFVPVVRTQLDAGETLRVEAIVLGAGRQEHGQDARATLFVRPLATRAFVPTAMVCQGRGVYAAAVDDLNADFEYYVEVETDAGRQVWPATAPTLSQTVVVTGGK